MKSWAKSVLIVFGCLTLYSDANTEPIYDDPDADYLSHLFIAPKGQMIPSGVVSVAFGGAFASQGGKEYLGLFSVGLGGVAEVEVSTAHVVTNILDFSEPIGTTVLKFMVHQRRPGSHIPTFVVALRSNVWSNVEGSEDDLAGPASPGSGVTRVEFEALQTSLYLTATADIYPTFTLHGGLVWHELRTRNLEYGGPNPPSNPGDSKEGMVSIFAGVEHKVNETTHSIIEFGSQPRIVFDDSLQEMDVEQLWHGMAGVRFFITRFTALDAGIRYRSGFSGLADTEIHTGLNFGFDVFKGIKKMGGKE